MNKFWTEESAEELRGVIDGWNKRTYNGPMPCSATIFSEEDKVVMRSWAMRGWAGENIRLNPRSAQDLNEMRARGVNILALVELVERENGR